MTTHFLYFSWFGLLLVRHTDEAREIVSAVSAIEIDIRLVDCEHER